MLEKDELPAGVKRIISPQGVSLMGKHQEVEQPAEPSKFHKILMAAIRKLDAKEG